MNIHASMEEWGDSRPRFGNTLGDRIGVAPAEPGSHGLREVIEIMRDGEAHTTGTLDAYLQHEGIDLSGCQIAACLVRMDLDGYHIRMLAPYDGFGCPQRFKLTGMGLPKETT